MRLSFFFLLILLFLFFFLFFPSWIIQAFSLLFLLVLAASFLYSRLMRYWLTVARSDRVLRGYRQQKLTIGLIVENRGPLPLHQLMIRDLTGPMKADESATYFLKLRGGERRVLTYQVESLRRGEFEVGPIVMSGSDPLGFFPWKTILEVYTRVIVYPRVYPLRLIDNQGLPAGNIRTENRIYEDVTRYRTVREYVAGDDTRRINWKVSARMGKLFCLEYLPTLYFPVLVALNLTTAQYPLKYRNHRAERAIETAASLITYFVNLRQEVGLVASGDLPDNPGYQAVPIKPGTSHAVALLELLARIEMGASDFSELLMRSYLRIPYGTRICIVSPPLEDEQYSLVDELARRGYRVEIFQIPRIAASGMPEGRRRFVSHFIEDYGDELLEA